ncbi:hypothetical protein Trydic_g12169 [Trypoxylus dichotomus]
MDCIASFYRYNDGFEISKTNANLFVATMGRIVLRLPPYHCDLNPAELVWSTIIRKVVLGNGNGSCSVEALIRQVFAETTPSLRQTRCKHIKTVEKKYS